MKSLGYLDGYSQAAIKTACERLGVPFPPPVRKEKRIAAEIRVMRAPPCAKTTGGKPSRRLRKVTVRTQPTCEGPGCDVDISHRDIQARFCSARCAKRAWKLDPENRANYNERNRLMKAARWEAASEEEKEKQRRKWRLDVVKRGDRREYNRAYYHSMTREQYERKLATNRKNRRIRAAKKAMKELVNA